MSFRTPNQPSKQTKTLIVSNAIVEDANWFDDIAKELGSRRNALHYLHKMTEDRPYKMYYDD